MRNSRQVLFVFGYLEKESCTLVCLEILACRPRWTLRGPKLAQRGLVHFRMKESIPSLERGIANATRAGAAQTFQGLVFDCDKLRHAHASRFFSLLQKLLKYEIILLFFLGTFPLVKLNNFSCE